jgi:two-component system chemotaxis sensor kinase CheA
MLPIGTVFSRFQRIVRDLSKELGKDIGLEVSGADTELDKVLIEQIHDTLLHLVRNAPDHGIETPDARTARSKAARGRLHLAAYRDGGSIVRGSRRWSGNQPFQGVGKGTQPRAHCAAGDRQRRAKS